jgi:hypothetical protein
MVIQNIWCTYFLRGLLGTLGSSVGVRHDVECGSGRETIEGSSEVGRCVGEGYQEKTRERAYQSQGAAMLRGTVSGGK